MKYAEDIFEQLCAMYQESWRTYHNVNHISACLGFFDDCSFQANEPDAVEMAIWFHDCVYVVGAKDNEAKSRDWFMQISREVLDDGFRNKVDELIMDTLHQEVPSSSDGKLMADIDLTSFGLPWDEYMKDGDNVRKELDLINQNEDELDKFKFLDMLLSRPSIYSSDFYLEHYEPQAQNNIKRHKQNLVASNQKARSG